MKRVPRGQTLIGLSVLMLLLALSAILIVMSFWRKTRGFWRYAYSTNAVIMCLGFVLMGYQITGYFVNS